MLMYLAIYGPDCQQSLALISPLNHFLRSLLLRFSPLPSLERVV